MDSLLGDSWHIWGKYHSDTSRVDDYLWESQLWHERVFSWGLCALWDAPHNSEECCTGRSLVGLPQRKGKQQNPEITSSTTFMSMVGNKTEIKSSARLSCINLKTALMELIHALHFNILYKTDFPLPCTYFSACAEQKKWNEEGQYY